MNEEQQGTTAGGDEIRIVGPLTGRHIAGKPFPVNLEQQVASGDGAAAGQFSNSPAGPWATCRAPGGGGDVEGSIVPWSAQIQVFSLDDVTQHTGPVFFRVGAWNGQTAQQEELTGSPTIASNVIELPSPLVVTQVPAEGVERPAAEGGGVEEAPE